MKRCAKETTRIDRIERIISDETVMVVYSPIMLRRKKKAIHPVLKGLVCVQQFPISEYSDFLAIDNLYFDATNNGFYNAHFDIEEWHRRTSLRNKLSAIDSYWWVCSSKRSPNDMTFEFLFKTPSHNGNVIDMERKFNNDYVNKRNWNILRYGEVIPILRRYKIINKLLDELIVVKLSEQ